METLKDKVAFVTGGASGIGLGIAKAMVAAGMRVVIADVREDHLKDARAWFVSQKQSRRIKCLKLDVTNRKAYARAADQAEKAFGKIHVLVNNAGLGLLGAIDKTKYDDWDWGLSVMIGGVINGLLTVLPRIRAHGEGGHVVNTVEHGGGDSRSPTAPSTSRPSRRWWACRNAWRASSRPTRLASRRSVRVPCRATSVSSASCGRTSTRRTAGLEEFEKSLAQRPQGDLWMDPVECGQRVVRGIQRNDLYIFTHPEFKAGARERCEKILASFPDEPINQPRAEAIKFLLSNPIFKPA